MVGIKLPYARSTEHNALLGLYCDATKKASSQEVVGLDDRRTKSRTIHDSRFLSVVSFRQQSLLLRFERNHAFG